MTETTAQATDRQAVEELVGRLQQAWNAGDGQAFAAAFWDDADFTVWDGFAFTGRQAIADDHVWAFTEGPRRGSTSTFTVTRIRPLSGTHIIVTATARIEGTGSDGQPNTHLAVPRGVAEQRDGEWRFIHFTNLLYNPVPPAHHPANRGAEQPAGRER